MESINRNKRLQSLLRLSHELGREDRHLAILGEGNTSVKLDPATFIVKASGSSLATLSRHDVVECRIGTLLALLDKTRAGNAELDDALRNSRVDPRAKKPSVESVSHAYLLSLPGVEFVGHTHAPAVNSILCSPRAREFAKKRLFPEEIVCCDVESILLPYTDPGLKLAQTIRRETSKFMRAHGRLPRVILIKNHGIITLGRSVEAVLAAMLMAEKVAGVWIGAAALGGPEFMTSKEVTRIADGTGEIARRKVLNL